MDQQLRSTLPKVRGGWPIMRERERLEKPLAPFVEVRTTACRAGGDGECYWKRCPQLRDDEPERSGRDCPLLSESRL